MRARREHADDRAARLALNFWMNAVTSSPFRHPQRRLARARHHIDELSRSADAFMATQPHRQTTENLTEGRRRLYVEMSPLPDLCEDLAVDAIAALRASLDYAVFASVRAAGIENARSAYFPFADTAVDLEKVIKGRCKDVSSSVIDVFRVAQPFSGGAGERLWALNKLRGLAEHASVIEARLFITQGSFRVPGGIDPATVSVLDFRWDHERHRVALAEVGPPVAGQQYKFDFTIALTMPEAPLFSEEPAAKVLYELAAAIEKLIEKIALASK